MRFHTLAAKNLLRHKTRTLLTLLGIALSVAVLFSILSFNRGFENGLSRELDRTGLHFMVVPSGCAHEVASLVLHGAVIPKFLDTAVLDEIRTADGLDLVSPFLVAQLPNPQKDRIDLIYGVEMAHVSALKPFWQVQGRIPATAEEILMGAEVAAHYGVRLGDPVIFSSTAARFTVTGIIQKTGSQDDAFIYMPLQTAQEILKKPSGATAIGIRVKDPMTMSTVVDDLSRRIPGIQIITMNQVMNSISNLAASAKAMSLSLALIAIFVSAVGVMNSILMAVFERTQEIGMMRAIGASRIDIFRIIIKETCLLTLSGGVAGVVISVIGGGLIESFIRKVMPYVPSGDMVSFDPLLATSSLAFTFLIGICAGLYPAWKASTINPIEAIRG